MKRRQFIHNTARGLAVGMVAPYILTSCGNSSDGKVNVGFLGVGGRGQALLKHFMLLDDVQVLGIYDPFEDRRNDRAVWVSEVHEKRNANKDIKFKYEKCMAHDSYAALLDDKRIDAVVIATPDHWHVPLSYAAVDAGKDVYVEKPLGLTIEQGQILRKKVHEKKAILQYGTQQRSNRNFWLAAELTVREKIGKLERIDAWCPGQNREYTGSTEPIPVPGGFDYDVWLGPAPVTPYTKDRCTSEGSWYVYDNAIGFIAGWGAHPLDIAQWGNQSDDSGPVKYRGTGSLFPPGGLFDTINDWDIHCEYANGVKMHFFSHQHIPEYVGDYRPDVKLHGTTFWGSNGWVSVDRAGIHASDPELLKFTIEPGREKCYVSTHHQGNFIECVKSRKQPICTIDAAVRSDTISHLGNILIRSGASELRWDPEKEEIIDPTPAMKEMLHRPQRKPYDII